MPEETKPEVKDPITDPAKEKKEDKLTLESLAKHNKELNEQMEILKNQVSKGSRVHDENKALVEENKKLQETLQKVSSSIEGKTDKQKDSILEKAKDKLLTQGYDASAVDSLLEVISEVSDQRANQRVVPLILEATQDLIESDPDIDKGFLEKNSEAVNAEYNSYKPESLPRKIKQNLKKAYGIVKEQLAEEARKKETPEEKKKREEMVAGGAGAPAGKKQTDTQDSEFLDRIEKAGSKSGHFV